MTRILVTGGAGYVGAVSDVVFLDGAIEALREPSPPGDPAARVGD